MGYTSKEAPKGKFMIFGAGFSQVGGSMDVNGLVSGVEGVAYDEKNVFKTTAAQLQIPEGAGYKVRYYLEDGWYLDENNRDAYKPGWCDSNGGLVEDEITTGVAFWFKSVPGDANCLVSGEVSSDTSYEVDCPENFALRANPFPVVVNINGDKLSVSGAAKVSYDDKGVFKANAPQIQIPTDNGYKVRYYLEDGWYLDENNKDAYKPGWCDSNGGLVDDEIPAGQGIWTKGVQNSFKLIFTK